MEQSAETKKKDCPDAREQFPVEILEDERVDDLQRNGYHIIQKRNGFCFGMDAVLLAGFARVNRGNGLLIWELEQESFLFCWKPGMRANIIQVLRSRKKWQRWPDAACGSMD